MHYIYARPAVTVWLSRLLADCSGNQRARVWCGTREDVEYATGARIRVQCQSIKDQLLRLCFVSLAAQ